MEVTKPPFYILAKASTRRATWAKKFHFCFYLVGVLQTFPYVVRPQLRFASDADHQATLGCKMIFHLFSASLLCRRAIIDLF